MSLMNDPDYLIGEGDEAVGHLSEIGHVLEEGAALLLQVLRDWSQLRVEDPQLLELVEMKAWGQLQLFQQLDTKKLSSITEQ